MQNEEISIMHAMMDDEFHEILERDEILTELEKQKEDAQIAYFELMMILSRTFRIDGVVVSCITPAIWAYLYAIKSPYTTDGEIHVIDTDIFMYILHTGIEKISYDFIDKASGFCERNSINPDTAIADLKMLIYLSFRPLEMLPMHGETTEKPRFDVDWLTHLVSVVSPITGKDADAIIYNMSVSECLYYSIQKAREYDYKHEIRRRNSDEINAAIYARTMELGREYWEKNYKGHC